MVCLNRKTNSSTTKLIAISPKFVFTRRYEEIKFAILRATISNAVSMCFEINICPADWLFGFGKLLTDDAPTNFFALAKQRSNMIAGVCPKMSCKHEIKQRLLQRYRPKLLVAASRG